MTDASEDGRPPVVVQVHLNWPGAGGHSEDSYEIPRDQWDRMTPAERGAYCDGLAEEEADNKFSWGWDIADPADYAATEGSK